ncbi:hypothetical protein E2R51_12800 [Jeotgalibacillus sp. S-D1]|uniref:hypothetical protein n=1 Tax=Jeotgalibacillus sp. S-D1 TaxID=2552189 RepID=UPI00105A686A|nr:hypothetical protein [Jeotgalibacillus sp. S-D1]TDL31249.1 hypothetical protein E2R51_12800 [Jeotgalibacillus sp. S-D1]
MRKSLLNTDSIQYFFTRVKNSYEENGCIFVSFFARLTKEHRHTKNSTISFKTERVWVDIDECKESHASQKMKALPEGVSTYLITEEVFKELVKLSNDCPQELYQITPICSINRVKKFSV